MTATILSSTPLTLSSTALATFRTCAAVIRASSFVNWSSLFSASSISVLPINFFRYLSGNGSVNGNTILQQRLTRLSLSDLFSCNSKNVEDLHHNFRNCIDHFLFEYCFSVDLQSLEKSFYALEDVTKSVLTCSNILGCLRNVRIRMDRTKVLREIHTERRTPIPANITFAGENSCRIIMGVQISDTASWNIPDQHLLRGSPRRYKEPSQSDPAILSTFHFRVQTD